MAPLTGTVPKHIPLQHHVYMWIFKSFSPNVHNVDYFHCKLFITMHIKSKHDIQWTINNIILKRQKELTEIWVSPH